MSDTSNQVYTANGTCQCKAFEQGYPCRHRAASRLVTLYIERTR
ncbi:MAG TPA: SWIM zinc finger family protein [Pyrinomonadaceae bacterium]